MTHALMRIHYLVMTIGLVTSPIAEIYVHRNNEFKYVRNYLCQLPGLLLSVRGHADFRYWRSRAFN